MSEAKFVKEHLLNTQNPALVAQKLGQLAQPEEQPQSENEVESKDATNGISFDQAKALCEEQMQQLYLSIAEKPQEEQEALIEQAKAQINDYLSKFEEFSQQNGDLDDCQNSEQLDLEQQQQLYQQQMLTQFASNFQNQIDASAVGNTLLAQNGQQMDEQTLNLMQMQALQQQQENMFMESQGLNFSQDDVLVHFHNLRKKQMGNQLRQFSRKMFAQLNRRQRDKLFNKADQYLNKYVKDINRHLQNSNSTMNTMGVTENSAVFGITNDCEFTADPIKFLDEIENVIKKDEALNANFQRFVGPKFEDPDQEQGFTDFIISYHNVYWYYMHLANNYNMASYQRDHEKLELWGTEIFNLMMPYAQKIDPKLLTWIPKDTLEKFRIEYESDNQRIKTWHEIDNSYSHSSGSELNSNDDSQSNGTGSSNEQNISSNSQAIGDSSDQASQSGLIEDEDESMMIDNDMSQTLDYTQGGSKYRRGEQTNGVIPQSALTGRNRSLLAQLHYKYSGFKNCNKHEGKLLENLFKSLKDEKDWVAFCKILFLYFEGVLTLTDYLKLLQEKLGNKVKQELRDEIEKLMSTRDQNRRQVSMLLKPWNDTNNQTFEKIHDSSYFKIEEGFPIPTCTKKMMEEVYWKNLNDSYLSLAIGQENVENGEQKFRNTNVENIYKTEDKMYEIDTQIDNIEKSLSIAQFELEKFETLSEEDQSAYRFPVNSLNPLRFYWDQKFRKTMHEQFLKENKVFKLRDMNNLKQQFVSKLEFLRQQKASNLAEYKEQFKKNFTKSLDHKSFQYKDFMKKFLMKNNHVNKIRQISEDNIVKKRVEKNDVHILYGSGEQNMKSDYQFFNTFGIDFSGKFDLSRLSQLKSSPDYPIDMQFLKDLSDTERHSIQSKCPHVRFLFDNKQVMEITVKLVIQFIKLTSQQSTATGDKKEQLRALQFIVVNFMQVSNFEELDRESDKIMPLTSDLVDVLMNSADYYQKKYTKELPHMQEVFPFDDPSAAQSPLKIKKGNKIQQIESNQKSKEPDSASQKSKNEEHSEPSSFADPTQLPTNLYKEALITDDADSQAAEIDRLRHDMFVPRFKRGGSYKLMYGPLNIYLFLVYFYTVYERILKAKQLVERKVLQDFKDDFGRQEWSAKFKSRTQTLINERFTYLIKSILTVMYNSNVLDTNKYEDVARELLGNEAYLLFQVDKLINHCHKQLNILVLDPNCTSIKRLFQDFSAGKMKSETQYLSNFYQLANDQATQSSQANLKNGNNLVSSSQPPLNKETTNPSLNQQAFRFLFSPQSGIMSIHFVVLHPFLLMDSKKNQPKDNSVAPSSLESVKGLSEFTTIPMQLQNEPLPDDEPEVSPQIFLERNLRLMKKKRNKEHKIINNNGLQFNVIPNSSQMVFSENTEDSIYVRRQNNSLLQKRRLSQIAKDREYNETFRYQRIKRLKTLNSESGLTVLNEALDEEMTMGSSPNQLTALKNPESNENSDRVPVKKLTRSQNTNQSRSQTGSRKPTPNKLNGESCQ